MPHTAANRRARATRAAIGPGGIDRRTCARDSSRPTGLLISACAHTDQENAIPRVSSGKTDALRHAPQGVHLRRVPLCSPPPLAAVSLVPLLPSEHLSGGAPRHLREYQEALEELYRGGATTLVLDPFALREEPTQSIIQCLQRTGASALLYLSTRPGALSSALEFVQRVPVEVHVADGTSAFDYGHHVARLPKLGMPSQVTRHLTHALSRVPRTLREVAFLAWLRPNSSDLLAQRLAEARMSPISVRRSMERAGLASLSVIRRHARLAISWELLSLRTIGLSTLAVRSGFGGVRTLSMACRAALGEPPRRAWCLDESVVARHIAARCMAPGSEEGEEGFRL